MTVDIANAAAVLERARYRSTMFGHVGGGWSRWRRTAYDDRTMADQIAGPGLSAGFQETIVGEILAEVVARAIELPAPPTRGCDGGWHRLGDTDYPCPGCVGCRRDAALLGWTIGAVLWALTTAAERRGLGRAVAGMRALASIGAAVEAALSPGRGVSRWLVATVEEWRRVRVGRFYRVTGKRGSAKAHHGAEGEVARLETDERGTIRAALKITGESRWAWAPASALDPIRELAESTADKAREAAAMAQRDAARATREPWAGRKGDAVYVIDGPSAGCNGAVFWMGPGRDGPRVGVRFGAGERDVAWCSACDVVGAADLVTATARIAGGLTEIEAALALGDGADRAVLADSLEARGLLSLARAWRGPIPQAAAPQPVRRAQPGRRRSFMWGRA